MIVTIGNKSELSSVRRPPQIAILAAIEKQARRSSLAAERRCPHLIARDIGEHATRGYGGRVSLRDFHRSTAAQRCRPDRHFRLFGREVWVGREISFGRPILVVIATAYIDEMRAIRGQCELRDFLTVVLGIMRDLSWLKGRTCSDPDVAHAVNNAYPGNKVCVFCSGKFVGVGIIQRLLHREITGDRRAGRILLRIACSRRLRNRKTYENSSREKLFLHQNLRHRALT